jgi:hypothetical protein
MDNQKSKALALLEEIEENVGRCCAITMEPDEVLELIEKLKQVINQIKESKDE